MKELRELDEFREWVQVLLDRMKESSRQGFMFAEMQAASGLRSAEVLERGRWKEVGGSVWAVQLAKREDVREFREEELPELFRGWLRSEPEKWPYNYGSYEHDLRRAGVSFVFNGDKRATLSHAFRYLKFRTLFKEFGEVGRVQEVMRHKSAGSTMYYLLDRVFVQDRRAG